MIILTVLCQYFSPQIVDLLITFVSSDEPMWRGYFYTVLIVITTCSVSILNSQSFYMVGFLELIFAIFWI